MTGTRSILTFGLCVTLVGALDTHAASDAIARCQQSKLKAAGKAAEGLLKSYGSNATFPDVARLRAAITKYEDKFESAFEKAEARGGCPPEGEEATIKGQVEALVTDAVCSLEAAACDCGTPAPSRMLATVTLGTGEGGRVKDGWGSQLLSLACNGLYAGGGNVLSPPSIIPDYGSSVTRVSCCAGPLVRLHGMSAAETGSNRNCTGAGCLFGPPLPITNTATPA